MIKSYLFFLFLFAILFLLYKYSDSITQFSYVEYIIKSLVLLGGVMAIVFPYMKNEFPKSFTKKSIKKFMMKKYKYSN